MGRKRASFFSLLASIAAALFCGAAAAQTFPSRPLTLILTTDPATPVGPFHRAMIAEWSERLGKPVIMDIRLGASGRLGVLALPQAKGDGHLLTSVHSGIAVSLPLMEPEAFDKLPDRDYT